MTVHIVGSGIASLAAAHYLIEAGIAPGEIAIYEEAADVGGAMVMHEVPVVAGRRRGAKAPYALPEKAYVLPATRILEREYRCARDLLSCFESKGNPPMSVWEDTVEFNSSDPYDDTTRLLDKDLRVISEEHMGVSEEDRWRAVTLLATDEDHLQDVPVEVVFTPAFFQSEFFLAWSTMMGPLREHSAIEFRRYFWRFLHVVPHTDTLENVWRMRFNQAEEVALPIAKRLMGRGVQFPRKTIVEDVTFDQDDDAISAATIKLSTAAKPTPIGKDDYVFITLGSQIANVRIGSHDRPPQPADHPTDAWALWTRIRHNVAPRNDFGNPEKFFKSYDPANDNLSTWVTFTVTATDQRFLDRLSAISNVEPLRQGLVTLVDSPWMITVVPFPKPHFGDQATRIWTWWGFSLCDNKNGAYNQPGYVGLPITACSGRDILRETIHQFGFDSDEGRILESSVCVPCLLPHAGSVWLTRKQSDRPKVVPDGAKNFAFIGQFCEMPKDTMFTIEYSIRSGWEAVSQLLEVDGPPPVYQGDVSSVGAVLSKFVL